MNKSHLLRPGILKYFSLRVFSLALLLSGCTINLAPKFDQGISDHLSASSVEIFTMMANASGGTNSASFNKREEKYNSLIGRIEALELEIKARPMPRNKKIESLISRTNEGLRQRGVKALITAGDTAPSATALAQIIKNLVQMKNTDKENGLTPATVQLYKGFIELYLDQALTYERFLNR